MVKRRPAAGFGSSNERTVARKGRAMTRIPSRGQRRNAQTQISRVVARTRITCPLRCVELVRRRPRNSRRPAMSFAKRDQLCAKSYEKLPSRENQCAAEFRVGNRLVCVPDEIGRRRVTRTGTMPVPTQSGSSAELVQVGGIHSSPPLFGFPR